MNEPIINPTQNHPKLAIDLIALRKHTNKYLKDYNQFRYITYTNNSNYHKVSLVPSRQACEKMLEIIELLIENNPFNSKLIFAHSFKDISCELKRAFCIALSKNTACSTLILSNTN